MHGVGVLVVDVTADVECKAHHFVHDPLEHGEDVDSEEYEIEVLVDWFETFDSVDLGILDLIVFDDVVVVGVDEVLITITFCLASFGMVDGSLNGLSVGTVHNELVDLFERVLLFLVLETLVEDFLDKRLKLEVLLSVPEVASKDFELDLLEPNKVFKLDDIDEHFNWLIEIIVVTYFLFVLLNDQRKGVMFVRLEDEDLGDECCLHLDKLVVVEFCHDFRLTFDSIETCHC
jgi:hypothetical protein